MSAEPTPPEGATGVALEHREVRHEVLVPLPLEETRAQMQVYQQGLHGLLADEDWQDAGNDGRFLKKSGWRKIATWLNLSIEFRTDVIERHPVTDQIQRAKVIVRAVAPSGRFADGDGYCDVAESRFNRNKSKLENDLRGTATTRATNRAISNLVGMGAVSGEEIDDAGSAGPNFGPEQTNLNGPRAAIAYLLSPTGEVLPDSPTVDGVLQSVIRDLGYFPKAAALGIVAVAKAHRELTNPTPAAAPEGDAPPAEEEPVDAEVIEGDGSAEDVEPAAGSVPVPDAVEGEAPGQYLARLKAAGCTCPDPLALESEKARNDDGCPLATHGIPF